MEISDAFDKAQIVIKEVKKAVTGKNDCINKAFSAILSGGHILIEDVPGVGKTTLAMAFSRAMDLENHRVQFTPDVMPADIVGFNMYNKTTDDFVYKPGAIMCNLFLADEINRTSPKTQSALLEVMEEGMVTIDGVSRPVMDPFIVIATQNPKGSAGTSLLPESQLDRFMICMSMGYPNIADEIAIAKGKSNGRTVEEVLPVIKAVELNDIRAAVEEVYVHEDIYSYVANLVSATRENQYINLGISPRGTIACVKMAKSWAFLKGRNYVIPEDVDEIFKDIAKHRIVLGTKARVTKITEDAVLSQILTEVLSPVANSDSKYQGRVR